MKPHATVGMLRSTVANARMTIWTGPPTPDTREAMTARTNAMMAASVPAAIASKMVIASAEVIFPIWSNALAFGMNWSTNHTKPPGKSLAASRKLKSMWPPATKVTARKAMRMPA